jgi:hypothetical protein
MTDAAVTILQNHVETVARVKPFAASSSSFPLSRLPPARPFRTMLAPRHAAPANPPAPPAKAMCT